MALSEASRSGSTLFSEENIECRKSAAHNALIESNTVSNQQERKNSCHIFMTHKLFHSIDCHPFLIKGCCKAFICLESSKRYIDSLNPDEMLQNAWLSAFFAMINIYFMSNFMIIGNLNEISDCIFQNS